VPSAMGIFSPDPAFHRNGESFTIHWQGKGKFAIPAPATASAPPPSFAQNLGSQEWQEIMRQIDNTFEEPPSGCCSWDIPNEVIGRSMRDSLNTQFNPKGVAFSIDHFWSPSRYDATITVISRHRRVTHFLCEGAFSDLPSLVLPAGRSTASSSFERSRLRPLSLSTRGFSSTRCTSRRRSL